MTIVFADLSTPNELSCFLIERDDLPIHQSGEYQTLPDCNSLGIRPRGVPGPLQSAADHVLVGAHSSNGFARIGPILPNYLTARRIQRVNRRPSRDKH